MNIHFVVQSSTSNCMSVLLVLPTPSKSILFLGIFHTSFFAVLKIFRTKQQIITSFNPFKTQQSIVYFGTLRLYLHTHTHIYTYTHIYIYIVFINFHLNPMMQRTLSSHSVDSVPQHFYHMRLRCTTFQLKQLTPV